MLNNSCNLLLFLNLLKKKQSRRFINVLFFAIYYFQLSLKFNAVIYKPDAAINPEDLPCNYHLYRKSLSNYTYYFLQKQLFVQYRDLQLNVYLNKEMRVIYSKISIYCGLFSSFFKKIGNPRRKLKRNFPSVNIAFRFKISKYVIF